MDVRCVLVNTAVLLTALAAAHGSRLYPAIVRLERTDSETFVSQPTVLSGVQNITVKRVPFPKSKGIQRVHRYDRVPNGALDCGEPSSNSNTVTSWPNSDKVRRDLPGMFVCGNKSIVHVTPVIEVETGRMFNVSLDFVKVQNPAELSVWPLKRNDLTFAALRLAPSGIVFVSGLFPQNQAGTLTFQIDFRIAGSDQPYRIFVLIEALNAKDAKESNGSVATFTMTSNQDNPYGNIELRIEALKCAARAFRIDPLRLYDVAFQAKDTYELSLQARSDDGWCIQPSANASANRPVANESCNSFTFIKDEVTFDPERTRCDAIATSRQQSRIVDSNVQNDVENDDGEVDSDVELDEDNKILPPHPAQSNPEPVTAAASASQNKATPTSTEARSWTTNSAAVKPTTEGTNAVTGRSSLQWFPPSDSNTQRTKSTSSRPTSAVRSSTASERTSAVRSSTASEPTLVASSSTASEPTLAASSSTTSEPPLAASSSTTSGRPTAAFRDGVPVASSTARSTPTPTATPSSLSSSSSDASVPDLVVSPQNSNQKAEVEQSRAKLKSAVYGMAGLVCLVASVLFVFLFKKVVVCKSNAGYDPVFVARHSNAA